MNKPDPKFKAGRYFRSISAMIKCLIIYCDFLTEEALVNSQIKWLIKQIRNQLSSFEKSIYKVMPDSDVKKEWGAIWDKEDFESVSRLLDLWVEMNNLQRSTLETEATNILINNFVIEEKS